MYSFLHVALCSRAEIYFVIEVLAASIIREMLSEISASLYQITWRNRPEDSNFQDDFNCMDGDEIGYDKLNYIILNSSNTSDLNVFRAGSKI